VVWGGVRPNFLRSFERIGVVPITQLLRLNRCESADSPRWRVGEHEVSEPDNELREFLENYEPMHGVLPLLHTTNAFSFKSICKASAINAENCKVFSEELVYLFYGRPAYRTASGQIGFGAKFSWPIVFIFDPEALPKPHRVFPFDTGAFAKGMYEGFFDRRQTVSDFNIGDDLDQAARCVSAFYTSNHEYYINRSTKNPEIDELNFTVCGVDALLRANQIRNESGPVVRDERSTSIEVQLSCGINLEETPPLALILPQSYINVRSVQDQVAKWNCRIVEYYECHNMQSYEFWHGQIYSKVSSIYRELGLLDG
jgi:hypothetical protein